MDGRGDGQRTGGQPHLAPQLIAVLTLCVRDRDFSLQHIPQP